MARTARYIPIDSAAHIMSRGNNKQCIFNNDSDKLFYWRLLNELKESNRIKLFHYCIMNNHVHLIVWITMASNLPKFMKQLNLSYFNYYKRVYGYCGHFWQGRYKSNIIENDAHLLHCGKYIELNPVRAGIVSNPEEYLFSSYRHYSLNQADEVVSDCPAFLALSEHPRLRLNRYIEFVVDKTKVKQGDVSGDVSVKRPLVLTGGGQNGEM